MTPADRYRQIFADPVLRRQTQVTARELFVPARRSLSVGMAEIDRDCCLPAAPTCSAAGRWLRYFLLGQPRPTPPANPAGHRPNAQPDENAMSGAEAVGRGVNAPTS